MRLFVAIPLPEDLRARLARLEEGLPGARWVAPENLHLTLRFIGEVDGRQAGDIDAALSQVRAERFAVTLAGVDRFGSGGKARTLWVGVEANPDLVRLHAKIEQALQRAGLAPERRKFKPHVTLARFNGNPGGRLYAYLSRNALLRSEPFVAEEFVLYSSFLSQAGAIHSPEAVYPLVRPVAGAP
ncbi:MAG: RNA 2',3'-cyclic phosphodiesterase [Kiloniellaceae bacterium]